MPTTLLPPCLAPPGLPPPVVIIGPTGSGKSDLALAVARAYGAVIVSMDAMQVYRDFNIGTAKVPAADRDPATGGVEHRCIDVIGWDTTYSAAEFAAEVNAFLPHRKVVICGGSTFYLRAWEQGLVDAPAVDLDLRAKLDTLADPHAALAAIDPVLAGRLHPNDRMRLVRGLEYHAQTGGRLSDAHAADPKLRRHSAVIGLDHPDLYARLDQRVLGMMNSGYLEEVAGLLALGVPRSARPMRTLGYEHLAAHLAQEVSLDEAIRLTQRDTRHFARKQRGFLRGRGVGVCIAPWEAVERAWGPPG